MGLVSVHVAWVPCFIPWGVKLASYRLCVYENGIEAGANTQVMHRTGTPMKPDYETQRMLL